MSDAELRDAAVTALKLTSVTYGEWKRKVDQGKYPDVTKTYWWKAFDHLSKIGLTAPPPAGRQFTGWDASLRPAFTPTRTVNVTSRSAFNTAWANLQAGDKLNVSGFTFAGQVNLWGRQLPGWAEIHFAPDVKFAGGTQKAYPAVSLADCRRVRFYGGDITNPDGAGVKLEQASDITWWDFKVHDTAGTGVFCFGINSTVAERNDLRGEIWNCGWDLSLDPHAEPGTGNHAMYLGGNRVRSTGTFIVKVHDQPAGAAIQIGDHVQDSVIEVDARRVTFRAVSQVAGNALQFWGDEIRNVRVPYVYGEDLAGRVSETDGMYGSNPAGQITVEYGRSQRVRLSPRYAADPSTVYLDCQ